MENHQNNQSQQSQENTSFSYTYSAEQQEELKKIRAKYEPRETDKMELLIRLDKRVTRKGTIVSLILGIVGMLLMGLGMSCTMVFMGDWFIPGIIIGLVGIGVACLAYPMYVYITRKERERIAPEILRLTDELLK